MENSYGLRDYRLEGDGDDLRGLGANRMKKRGISWTIKGAQRMARLLNLREMGQLHSRDNPQG
jgi:hypothetical protein